MKWIENMSDCICMSGDGLKKEMVGLGFGKNSSCKKNVE